MEKNRNNYVYQLINADEPARRCLTPTRRSRRLQRWTPSDINSRRSPVTVDRRQVAL